MKIISNQYRKNVLSETETCAETTKRASLFDSTSKVLFFSDSARATLYESFSRCGSLCLFLVQNGDDGSLTAVDEFDVPHSFNAPAAGAVVFVASDDTDSPLVDDALSLWERAQLPKPTVISPDNRSSHDTVLSALAGVMKALHTEARQTASDAVRLDRQIAALREDLEHSRTKLAELKVRDRIAGGLPIMGFERLPNNSFWDMSETQEGAQLLPYSGDMLRVIGVHMENAHALSSGQLTAHLRAREDDSVLQSWHVTNVNEDSWFMLSVDAEVPYRYRYIDLVLAWKGDAEEAPRISLAQATGDKEAFLRTGEGIISRNTLAIRIWTGSSLNRNDYARFVHFPSELKKLDDWRWAVDVSPIALSKIIPVIERTFNWPWLLAEKSDLFVHPTLEGPSMGMAHLKWNSAVSGLSTLLSNTDARGPEVFFAILVAAESLIPEAVEKIADGESSDNVVARLEWTALPPGTAKPVQLSFREPLHKFYVYFITKVAGTDVSHAHSWFRNIQFTLREK